ncbi:energy transducer TonB family protein [Acinetobacter populi]|uniref:TonB C-terminal domain-containing protein n=1 Tax=Acinetobacter populi TaxID=1582270 RepID=A0A1Z9YW99_9GAMM|nr:energy transducer TonB [Acinetobacter populi]OUY06498.1 hypothetical protein CAP51_11200 [Acinetobacter populi]
MSYSVNASAVRAFKPLKANGIGRPVIFIAVLCGHLLALWLLVYLHRPYQLSASPQINAIKVHFISMSKSDTLAQQSSAAQQAAPEKATDPQPKVENPVKPAIIKPVEQVKTLTATQSEKIVSRLQTKNETVQKTKVTESTSSPSPTLAIKENKASNQNLSSTDNGQGTAIQGSKTVSVGQGTAQGEDQHAGGRQEGNDKTLSRAQAAPLAQEDPIQVNTIDVLSFPLKYQDRELQNQDRQVILTIYVDSKGNTSKVMIKQSTGIAYLDQLAVKAAQKARFKPHKIDGRAVPIFVNLPIDFRMNQRGR